MRDMLGLAADGECDLIGSCGWFVRKAGFGVTKNAVRSYCIIGVSNQGWAVCFDVRIFKN